MERELAQSILASVEAEPSNVSRLARVMGRRTESVTSTVDEMVDRGLLTRQVKKSLRRGRPQELIHSTPLGSEYLHAAQALDKIPLMASPRTLFRAAEDGRYAARLETREQNTYSLFLELNDYVRSAGRPTERS